MKILGLAAAPVLAAILLAPSASAAGSAADCHIGAYRFGEVFERDERLVGK